MIGASEIRHRAESAAGIMINGAATNAAPFATKATTSHGGTGITVLAYPPYPQPGCGCCWPR
jgi:hypothetical protein